MERYTAARAARGLAGDARAGTYARAEARSRQRAWLRRHGLRLAIPMLTMVALPTAAAVLLRASPFTTGLVLGATAMAAVASAASWVVLVTGTGPLLMGDNAEQWTAQELRGLQRSGWRVVNHVAFERTDVDHLLVGPGGLVVVESKWSATAWRVRGRDHRVAAAVAQAQDGARKLRLWCETRTHERHVRAAVVLWGQIDVEGPVEVDGVVVIPGAALPRWLQELPTDRLPAPAVEAVAQVVAQYLVGRDAVEARQHPMPLGLDVAATRTSAAVAVGFASSLSVAWLLTTSAWAATAWASALVAAGCWSIRVRRWTWLGVAALTGVAVVAVVVLAALAEHALS